MGGSPLYYAAWNGRLDAVMLLLSSGAQVDKKVDSDDIDSNDKSDGESNDKSDGESNDASDEESNFELQTTSTLYTKHPLIIATRKNHTLIVNYLLSHDANPNIMNHQDYATPLMEGKLISQ